MARLTHQKWSDNIDLSKEHSYKHIYKRLWEIENMIENNGPVERLCYSKENVSIRFSKSNAKCYCYSCPNCGEIRIFETPQTVAHYCYKCGAKMDKERD